MRNVQKRAHSVAPRPRPQGAVCDPKGPEHRCAAPPTLPRRSIGLRSAIIVLTAAPRFEISVAAGVLDFMRRYSSFRPDAARDRLLHGTAARAAWPEPAAAVRQCMSASSRNCRLVRRFPSVELPIPDSLE